MATSILPSLLASPNAMPPPQKLSRGRPADASVQWPLPSPCQMYGPSAKRETAPMSGNPSPLISPNAIWLFQIFDVGRPSRAGTYWTAAGGPALDADFAEGFAH